MFFPPFRIEKNKLRITFSGGKALKIVAKNTSKESFTFYVDTTLVTF